MKIPFMYIVRSLFQRKASTLMTIGSFTLVVVALMALLSMIEGVNETLISSGAANRMFVINENATNENQSRLSPKEVGTIGTYSEIKLDEMANPIISPEIVKTAYIDGPTGTRLQANFRGVDLIKALKVHDGVKIIMGRFFHPDVPNEVIVGKSIYNGLDADLGEKFKAQRSQWTIVGVFEDGGSPFESEVWTSGTNMMLNFNISDISSVWLLVKNPNETSKLVKDLNNDRALSVFATSEQDYFRQGTSAAEGFQVLTWFIAVIMSIGAIFSAMNTMFASIADRAGELAAMRAIGFPVISIRIATLLESLVMALTGGIIAACLTWMLNGTTFRTPLTGLGYVSFELTITPALIITGLSFALIMGIMGGWLPARHATRIPIIEALNS